MRTIATKNNKPVDIKTIRELQKKGKSIQEIATITGISRQAVYQKIKADERQQGLRTTADDVASKLTPRNKALISTIGSEKASAFVQYHVDLLKMREGVNKNDVPDLYNRFRKYLEYCAANGVVPNNMSAYLAIGICQQDISAWKTGAKSSEHRAFAEAVSAFFASVHEQGGTDGVLNPIQSIFWQKAYDGLSDQPKIEVQLNDPLGEKRSAEQIAKDYIDLPD